MFEWLNHDSREFLKDYLVSGETPESRILDIANTAEKILEIEGFSDKFYDYMSKGYYSLSSPVWSNFGRERGCPISCFNSYCGDSCQDIMDTVSEVSMMTKLGGGTSGYFGDVRPEGSTISSGGFSDGSVSFMRLFDTVSDVWKQAQVRRGSFAAYLPIEHSDIDKFLNIRHPGDLIQKVFPAVTVSDNWMQSMIDGDQDKRKTWAKVLKSRTETGTPYIMFSDNVNNRLPKWYTDNNLKVNASNLCSEILLNSDVNHSFVCCLSSINVYHWEEIKNTDAIETMVYFLDAVLTEFINKASNIPFMQRSVNFAKRERAIGVGILGWHSYLQDNMIPFESLNAQAKNVEIAKTLSERCHLASQKMANEFGEPELLKGYGRRHSFTNALAPTTSSSFILGQISQSFEAFRSNYYIKNLAKGRFTVKNPKLSSILTEKGRNTEDVWDSILKHDGSVQHLTNVLSDYERNVFKTFKEISQMEVIKQAAQRQKYIDQGQSLNILIDPKTPVKDINSLHVESWKSGITCLYYQHSINASQEAIRNMLTCSTCEG